MKAKSWIVIGIILFSFMTYNNSSIILEYITNGSEINRMFEELWNIRYFAGAQEIYYGMIILWTSYAILHIVSVYMIIEGVKRRRNENDITIDKSKNKVEERENSSLEILKKRYASGEISEEEFNKIKKDLE